MKKLSQVAAVATLGLACAMPVMAQGSATTDTSASTTAPASTVSATPNTTSMGAGPSDLNRDTENDRDMGWIGLLGLAGLLGLRRKRSDYDRHNSVRPTTAR
ncbi:WGxxGxxG family protein [Ramlibacter sp. PS3R-8]|uniref:WGxxGxxG family protein n=1 Tax=Ramlibacter sp. PS3R-8 TaxID=3133437 RepID=UPI00309A32F5